MEQQKRCEDKNKKRSLVERIIIGIVICLMILGLLLAILVGGLVYITKYRLTEVGVETSYNGKHEVVFYEKGEPQFPFGSTTVRVVVREVDGETIEDFTTTINDDGAILHESNWKVDWYPGGLDITLKGSEQEDRVYPVYYGTEDSTVWNTEAEIFAVIQSRYGSDVQMVAKQGNAYEFTTGEFDFQVQNDFRLTDNYYENFVEYFSTTLSAKYGRHVTFEWQEDSEQYVPVITFHGRYSMEMESFCNDVCDIRDECLNDIRAVEAPITVKEFDFYIGETRHVVWLNYPAADREAIYNIIYQYVERGSMEAYEEKVSGQTDSATQDSTGTQTTDQQAASEATQEVTVTSVSQDIWNYYLTLDPACTYTMQDGTEYRLLEADRALGSSYYVLIALSAEGEQVLVNQQPHCGSGGAALWLTFVENDSVGFTALAYSGGSYGSLYRTEDGGQTFTRVELPSAKITLPDGTLYNPFVMPEKVYEENGKLYLLVGQGPDGDYYGEKGFCAGLYESADHGKTWDYVKEVATQR